MIRWKSHFAIESRSALVRGILPAQISSDACMQRQEPEAIPDRRRNEYDTHY